MNLHKRNALILFIVVTVLGSVALAAATGDRLKSPVMVGQGQAVNESITFDMGSSSAVIKGMPANKNIGFSISGSTPGPASNAGVFVSALNYSPAFALERTGANAGAFFFNPHDNELDIGDSTAGGAALIVSAGAVSAQVPLQVVSSGATPIILNNTSWGAPSAGFALSQTNSGVAVLANNAVNSQEFDTSGNTAILGQLSVTGAVTLNHISGNVPHACTLRSTSGATTSTVSCSAGEIVTGGGCAVSSTAMISNFPASTSSWTCTNTGGATTAYAICCLY